MASTTARPGTMEEIIRLVDGFEDCSLPGPEFDHVAHLIVATCYLTHYPETYATERMIAGIQRYNHAHGKVATANGRGYHETITLFWLAMVRRQLTAAGRDATLLERVGRVVDAYADRRKLFLEYYTYDRIMSARARQTWVEPDRKSLDH